MTALEHQKIFSYDPLHAREISENYLSENTERGQLFIVLEAPQHKISQQALIDEFIQKTANYFDILKQENPELLLEEILQKINQFLPVIAAESKIRNWLSGLAVAVGLIQENSVYLSSIGNINAFIIHSNQLVPLTEKGQPINPAKIFADIVSGQMSEGDCLIISTDSLFDYISLEKIKQIIKQYSCEAAAKKINNLLEGVPDFVTFNAVLIKKPALTDLDLAPLKPRYGAEGVEDKGAKPDTILAADHGAKNFRARSPQIRTKLEINPAGFNNLSFFRKIIYVFRSIGLFFRLVYRALVVLAGTIKRAGLFIFSKNYRHQQEDQSLKNISAIGQNKYSWWQSLSLLKKISLLTLLVIALVFVQSLVFLTQQKSAERKDESYEKLLTDVSALLSEADTKLIYDDENAAEQILVEVQNRLSSASAHSAEQQKQIDSLQEKVWHQINKVRRIHEVPAPVEIADLTTKLTAAQQIVQKNGVFYILDSNVLYQWTADHFDQLATFENSRLLSDWPNQNKLLVGNDSQFYIFDLDNKKLTDSPVRKSTANNSIQDLGIYGNNLYVLDNQANQIFKYPEKGDGFGSGTVWLKSPQDLSQASSLAVDGNLYVIDNQGNIKKFLKGELQEFSYHQPRPQIGAGAIIKTFRDSQYLYIIDPPNQRVLVLDKKGDIKDQFTSAKFDKLTDLAVDLAEKAIYLLNGNHLYLLPVNQN